MRRSTRQLLGLGLAGVLALAGCSESTPAADAAATRQIEPGEFDVPAELGGRRVDFEDVSDLLADGRRPYLDSAALYSIREDDDRLQATLQIGRFADDVDLTDDDFRNSLITGIGASPRRMHVGDHTVWVTGADRQTLSIWLDDEHLFVLSTRDGFEAGRAVLRDALEVEP